MFLKTLSCKMICTIQMEKQAPKLYPMWRTFFSEKVVALRRLVISSRRGCRQVPGLSVTFGSGAGLDLVGVDIDMMEVRFAFDYVC